MCRFVAQGGEKKIFFLPWRKYFVESCPCLVYIGFQKGRQRPSLHERSAPGARSADPSKENDMFPCPFRTSRHPAEHIRHPRRLPQQAEGVAIAVVKTMVRFAKASARKEHPITQNHREKHKKWLLCSDTVHLLQSLQQHASGARVGQSASCQGRMQRMSGARRLMLGRFCIRLPAKKAVASG